MRGDLGVRDGVMDTDAGARNVVGNGSALGKSMKTRADATDVLWPMTGTVLTTTRAARATKEDEPATTSAETNPLTDLVRTVPNGS